MKKMKSIVDEIYLQCDPLKNFNASLYSNRPSDELKEVYNKLTQELKPADKKRIHDELFSWGPIEKLKERADILEIVINGWQDIYYENQEGMHRLDDQFLTEASFRNFIERTCQKAKILISQKDPFANGHIGSLRIHLVTPPISQKIILTIRKHSEITFKLSDFLNSGFINHHQGDKIIQIMEDMKNFLVIGPTGSGKTTLLNSLLKTITKNQRAVIIEDTDEIHCPNPISLKLLTREICPETLKPISMEDLVKQSLRMRPDRLVIGEVRGKEAKDLLMALATGHSGSMGTLHAQSAAQALYRLEMLIQMGAPQWNLYSIRQLIQMSLDYLIVLKEDRQQKGIEGIYKIGSHEKFGLLLEKTC